MKIYPGRFLYRVAIFFVLYFVSFIFCLNPFLVSSADYTVFYDYSIDLTKGTASNIELNISIPQNSSVLLCSTNCSISSDSFSNDYLCVCSKNAKIPFDFSAYLSVQSNSNSVRELDLSGSYSVPSEYGVFLKCNPQINCEDETLKKLALDSSLGFESDFEKISALAYWVNSNMIYDLSYVGKNLSASQILTQKRGVCTDYSTLFATLARSLGYPTRFVNGYAYSTVQQKWVGHAWNEVYIGKWIGVDSTWLEVGAIDATHVALIRSDKNVNSIASISALVSPSDAQLVWKGSSDINDVSENSLKPKSIHSDDPFTNYELHLSHQKISNGSKFLVYLKYYGFDYRILRAKLFSCVSDLGDIITFENDSGWAITSPEKISYIIWEGSTTYSLDENIIYKCPIALNSDYLQPTSLNVEISPRYSRSNSLEIEVFHPNILSANVQSITVRIKDFEKSINSAKFAYLLSENGFEKKPFDSNGLAVFDFVVYKNGKKTVYAWADDYEPVSAYYNVDYSYGQNMFDIVFDQPYISNQNMSLAFDFKSSLNFYSNKGNQTPYVGHILNWQWGNQSKKISIDDINSKNSSLKTVFNAQDFGNKAFVASVFDQDGKKIYSQSRNLHVYEPSTVKLLHTSITQIGENISIVRLLLNYSNSVDSIWVVVDGERYPVIENEIQISLVPKPYSAKIIWTDLAANSYQLPLFIRAPLQDDQAQVFFGIIIKSSTLNLLKVLAVSSLAMFLLAIVVFVRRRISNLQNFQ